MSSARHTWTTFVVRARFVIIVGWILAKAGYGVNGPKYSPKAH